MEVDTLQHQTMLAGILNYRESKAFAARLIVFCAEGHGNFRVQTCNDTGDLHAKQACELSGFETYYGPSPADPCHSMEVRYRSPWRTSFNVWKIVCALERGRLRA